MNAVLFYQCALLLIATTATVYMAWVVWCERRNQ